MFEADRELHDAAVIVAYRAVLTNAVVKRWIELLGEFGFPVELIDDDVEAVMVAVLMVEVWTEYAKISLAERAQRR